MQKFLPAAALAALCCLSPALFAQSNPSAMLHGDSNHPDKTQGWVETQLYFGLGPADAADQGISETQWRAFLDKEVSSRFPAGFSVIDVYGQWLNKPTAPNTSGRLERIRTKMIVVVHNGTPENSTKIDAIRSAWKQLTHDQSVLRVTTAAAVSF